MSYERRQNIILLANEYDLLVLEDDPTLNQSYAIYCQQQ